MVESNNSNGANINQIHSWFEEFELPSLAKTYRYSLFALARVLSVIYAVGAGITVAGFYLSMVTPGVGQLFAASLLFAAAATVNLKISWKSAPEVLLFIFGMDYFGQGLTEYYLKDDNGQKKLHRLSFIQKILLGFGLLCAISSSAVWAALAYGEALSSLSVVASVFGGSAIISILASPFAWTLVVATFVCITAMNVKEIADYLGPKQIHLSLKNLFTSQYFRNLFSKRNYYYSNLSAEEKKKNNYSPDAIPAEKFANVSDRDVTINGVVTIIMSIVFIGISVIGDVSILLTGTKDLNMMLRDALSNTIKPATIRGISYAMGMGFAMLGEIPFVISVAITTAKQIIKMVMGWLGYRNPAAADQQIELSKNVDKEGLTPGVDEASDAKDDSYGFMLVRFVNAAGHGLIAAQEGISSGNPALAWLSGLCETTYSFSCGAAGDEDEGLGIDLEERIGIKVSSLDETIQSVMSSFV